jgi:L-alanine-DL-glutamate epimerase-like enolase superfamily enzyme
LWDLNGKMLRRPVFRLLGGASEHAPVYASAGMYGPSPEDLAAEFAAAIETGLGGAKIKAAGAPLADDVARVKALRKAIGNARLMVDAMFAPSVAQAIELGVALAPFGLHFYEAPTAVTDLAGWSAVRKATGHALAGPEMRWGLSLHRDWLAAGAVDLLQFDVAICGGISEGKRLAALAEAWRKPITLHAAGSAIAFAASAHLGASAPNLDSLEFHLLHQALFERLWQGGYRLADGHIALPERPGLGLDIAPDDAELLVI